MRTARCRGRSCSAAGTAARSRFSRHSVTAAPASIKHLPPRDPIRAIVVTLLTLLSSSLAVGAAAKAATSFATFAAPLAICYPSKLFLHLTNLLTSPVLPTGAASPPASSASSSEINGVHRRHTDDGSDRVSCHWTSLARRRQCTSLRLRTQRRSQQRRSDTRTEAI
jgi:hypothetical protein